MRTNTKRWQVAAITLAALALPVMALAQVVPTRESLQGLYAGRTYSPYAQRGFPSRVYWGGFPASEIFKIGASFRLRTEIRDDFKFGSTDPGNDEQFLLTQLRVNATLNPATRATVFVEIQDARIFGEEGIDQDAIPNIFADELDLHQGYLQLDLSSGQLPVDLTVGRHKFNLGAQRLVASLEWVNTVRVWDGVRLDLGRTNERTLSAFASKLVPVNPRKFNWYDLTGNRMLDSYFYGAYFTDFGLVQGGRLEAYWLFRRQEPVGSSSGSQS